jgi:hypothetical protein
MEKSLITSGQKDQLVQVVSVATRKEIEKVIDALSRAGDLNSENCQRIIAQGDKIVSAIKLVAKGKIIELAGGVTRYLKRVLIDNKFIIDATDGKVSFSKISEVISCRDNDLEESLYKDTEEESTNKTFVHVYNLFGRATFAKIFGSFGENINRLCFTKKQIMLFAKDYLKILKASDSTFYLFKCGGNIAVMEIQVSVTGQVDILIRKLSDSYEWWGDLHTYNFIIPKL